MKREPSNCIATALRFTHYADPRPSASLGRRIDELVALKICKKINPESDREIFEYEGLPQNANHFKLTPKWAATLEKYQGQIRIGGRIDDPDDEKESIRTLKDPEDDDQNRGWF
jgi:hypothetical protein